MIFQVECFMDQLDKYIGEPRSIKMFAKEAEDLEQLKRSTLKCVAIEGADIYEHTCSYLGKINGDVHAFMSREKIKVGSALYD